jgi:hypothetical protein
MGLLRRILGADTTTDVLDILREQHTQVDQLLAQLESGRGKRRAIFTELADLLAAHATIEEKLFYPTVLAAGTKDQLHEAVEEHLSVKRLLADMIAMGVDDEQFDAKLTVLKEQISHHAHKEEERNLFPKVHAMLSRDERAALGNEMLVMFEQLMQSHPYKQVPAQTAAAAKLPPLRK